MPVAVAGCRVGLDPHTRRCPELDPPGSRLGVLAQNWLGNPDLALFSVMGMMVWFQIGFPLVIFFTALQRMDQTSSRRGPPMEHPAGRTFIHVTIHQIRPEIFVVVLMTTIATFKVFAQVFVLTRGGPGTATYVPSYYSLPELLPEGPGRTGVRSATVVTMVVLVVAVVTFHSTSRRGVTLRRSPSMAANITITEERPVPRRSRPRPAEVLRSLRLRCGPRPTAFVLGLLALLVVMFRALCGSSPSNARKEPRRTSRQNGPLSLPQNPTMDKHSDVLECSGLRRALRNSFVISACWWRCSPTISFSAERPLRWASEMCEAPVVVARVSSCC